MINVTLSQNGSAIITDMFGKKIYFSISDVNSISMFVGDESLNLVRTFLIKDLYDLQYTIGLIKSNAECAVKNISKTKHGLSLVENIEGGLSIED